MPTTGWQKPSVSQEARRTRHRLEQEKRFERTNGYRVGVDGMGARIVYRSRVNVVRRE